MEAKDVAVVEKTEVGVKAKLPVCRHFEAEIALVSQLVEKRLDRPKTPRWYCGFCLADCIFRNVLIKR